MRFFLQVVKTHHLPMIFLIQQNRLARLSNYCLTLMVIALVTASTVPCLAQPFRNQSTLHDLFPVSRFHSNNLNDASKLIADKKYSVGIPVLQSMLEASEDFVSNEKGLDFVSLKRLALQAIANLPEEGKRFYLLEYGAVAEQLLNRAIEQDDIDLLQEVVRRYFFTKAGADAAYFLGAYYLERGDFWAATRQWESLSKQHPLAASKEPHLTFKLAVAWYHIGNQGKCRQALMRLKRLIEGGAYQFPNGKKVMLFTEQENPVEWLSHLVGRPDLRAAREQKNWSMYRGGSSRLSSAAFAVPSTQPLWRFSTIKNPRAVDQENANQLETIIQKLGNYRRKHNNGVLPAASPLIIHDKVIFRTHRNLKAVSLTSGKLSWETALSDELYRELLRDLPSEEEELIGAPRTPLEMYLTQRAWQDYTVGHLSTDGNLVYSVENVGFIAGFSQYSQLKRDNVLVPKSYNRLMAFEVDSGKFVWEIGGPRMQNAIDYSGHYFLGPPLPLDGKLYCLAEEGREFRLLVLDAQTGKSLWTQSLYRTQYPIARDITNRQNLDHARRRMGLSPSMAHGVIVCQTGSGCTVGIDAINHRLLWRNLEEGGREIGKYEIFSRDINKNNEGWAEFSPVIYGDRVLIYSRKLQSIQCLNLFDGRLLWSRPRRSNLFIATIQDGKILLVGNDQIEAIKLSDGSPAWPKSRSIAELSGRGIVVKNTYFQPVESGEILSIRISDGLILARTRVSTDSFIGNLIAGNGVIVSQNETELVAFHSVKSIRNQIRLASKSNSPEDLALAEVLRGELSLFSGDVNQAILNIEKSIQIKPTLRAKRLYADILMENLEHDFNRHENQVSKLQNLVVDERQKQRLFTILAEKYHSQGKIEAALENYLKLSELKSISRSEKTNEGAFVRMDRWIRSELEFMVSHASGTERVQIKEFFFRYYRDKLANADLDVLERFIRCCGNLPEASQAQVDLIQRLEQAIAGSSAVRKSELRRQLMKHLENVRSMKLPETAPFATAKLAEIYLRSKHYSQAADLIQELETRWPDAISMRGKTARQLSQQWQSESEFQKWKNKSQKMASDWSEYSAQVYYGEQPKGQNTSLPVEIVGLTNSFFKNFRLEIGPAKEYLFGFDSWGKQQWAFSLSDAEIEVPDQDYFSARVYQHYLVVNLRSHFFVLDTLNRDTMNQPALLWKQRLIPGPPSVRDYISIRRDGPTPLLRHFETRDMNRELIGQIGTINEEFICYQVGNELIAAELLTGKILWKCQGVAAGSKHFGDAKYVIVVNSVLSSRPRYVILSGQSGENLRSLKLDGGESSEFAFERYLLTQKREADAARRLQLMDLTTGKEVWNHLLTKSAVFSLGQSHEIVVLESDGVISFLDLKTGKKKLQVKDKISAQHIDALLVQNSRQYLIFASLPFKNSQSGPFSLLNVTSSVFNGIVYSVDRKTGQLMWSYPLEAQGVDLSQFLDLPVISFGRRKNNRFPSRQGRLVDLQVVDLRSGKEILKESIRNNRSRIWLQPDVDTKNILIEPFQIRLSFEEPPVAARKP